MCISTVSLAELLGVENLAKSYGVMQIAGSLAYFTTSPYHGTCNFFSVKTIHNCPSASPSIMDRRINV